MPAERQKYAKSYRKTILEGFEERCSINGQYSQRAFARDLGLTGNTLSEILSGKQGLSRKRAQAIGKRLGLDPRQQDLFANQASAAHGRSELERSRAAEALVKMEKARPGRTTIETAKFDAIAKWYHFALLELLKLDDLDTSIEGIGRRLNIHPKQVASALDRLRALGLIELDADGRPSCTSNSFVGDDVPSDAIRQYHRGYLERATDALTMQSMESRSSNTLVLAMDQSRLDEFKARLQDFIVEIDQEFSSEGGRKLAGCVYGVSLHGFRIDNEINE